MLRPSIPMGSNGPVWQSIPGTNGRCGQPECLPEDPGALDFGPQASRDFSSIHHCGHPFRLAENKILIRTSIDQHQAKFLSIEGTPWMPASKQLCTGACPRTQGLGSTGFAPAKQWFDLVVLTRRCIDMQELQDYGDVQPFKPWVSSLIEIQVLLRPELSRISLKNMALWRICQNRKIPGRWSTLFICSWYIMNTYH